MSRATVLAALQTAIRGYTGATLTASPRVSVDSRYYGDDASYVHIGRLDNSPTGNRLIAVDITTDGQESQYRSMTGVVEIKHAVRIHFWWEAVPVRDNTTSTQPSLADLMAFVEWVRNYVLRYYTLNHTTSVVGTGRGPVTVEQNPDLVDYHGVRCHYAALTFAAVERTVIQGYP